MEFEGKFSCGIEFGDEEVERTFVCHSDIRHTQGYEFDATVKVGEHYCKKDGKKVHSQGILKTPECPICGSRENVVLQKNN